ncbi:hypothetical protein BU16DRAFT_18446 [Lophium mytilinum]|uniref:Argonaute linker 1 domain-containing protein n=1 Tax=Lophium mytilinum TaxID=390894 RepID=A0A6A6RH37_9PEZI|nr:hypothetical protein BU16DRAFT_18446 [Lophium mytilinum]
MGLSKATKGKITEGWQKKPCVKCESPEHTAAACTVPATAKEAWKAAGQFDANDKKHAERLLQTLKNPAGPPPKPTQAPKGSPKQQSGQSTMQSTTSSQPSTGRPLAWNLGMTNAQQQQTAIPPQTQPVFESNKLQMKGYKYQNYERQFPLEDPVRSRPLVAGPVYDFGGKINEVKTTAEEKQGQALTVVANYLEVKKVPEILYEYSVSCAQDVQVEGQNIKERKINKIAELRRIFHALTVQLNLKDRHDWATNFSNIWCKSPIQLCGSYSTEPGASESFNALNYRKQNGEMKTLKRIDVMLVRSIEPKYLASHDPFDTSFVPKNNDAEQHPSVIATALNAIISRKICDVDESRITQVGANKFFVNNGYSPMTSLYAKRGYFTSIRPGSGNRTLLNVNTATSAFFKPTSVTDFERVLEHEEGRPKHYSRRQIERLLRGKVLRIAYERPHLAGKPDPNLEHHRLKVFQDFGQSPPNQIFTKQTKETKKTKEIKETEETKEQMSVQAWYRGKSLRVENITLN